VSIPAANVERRRAQDWARQDKPIRRFVLTHSGGIEYAKTIAGLDFSIVDPFAVWSVYADYGKHQVCIGEVRPVPACDGDAAYAVDADTYMSRSYVNGTAFVPCVVRDRLADFAGRGEFDVYRYWLPCVTVKPVVTTDGPASPFKPAQATSQ
jgi:hypothetical protein